jgi:Holliday junction resolvasome RuvABC endonuclease subunit
MEVFHMSIKQGYIIGLDVSSSTVGAAIIDPENNNEIKALFYVSLKKEKGLINKIKVLKRELDKYSDMVGQVAIEEPLVMFKEGFSRAQILSMLSQFNGMAQFLTFLLYNVTPMMYNVNSARKLAFPTLKFPKGSKRKELVQQAVAEAYPDVEWPLKRTGRLKDECFDMSDAMVIALAHSATMRKVMDENTIV